MGAGDVRQMSNIIIHLIAVRDRLEEEKLDYYAEHIDYIIGLIKGKR